ncbi:MAG TPA: S1C family serine protease [Acidimicrobiales bacterium]|nr:S1C family serine protease [Acidimicrobiales bacterium]
MTVLDELSSAASQVVAHVGPSVVRIGRGGGRGCGVVLGDGVVATNAHNLRGDEALVTFADGRRAVGSVTATDVDGDLAVLRVDTAGAPAVGWAEGAPAIGDVVFVVTRSAAGGERVSFGMVSGTERAFRGPRGRRIKGSLEHTAPLPRGSSGSPVLTASGAVVGINTNRLGDGFYLALPADGELQSRLSTLSSGQSRTRPRLGVGLAPTHVARALRRSVGLEERDGLLVRVVEDGSPAANAGMREGDLIITVNGAAVSSADDLFDAMESAQDLRLTVLRGAEEIEITVQLDTGG